MPACRVCSHPQREEIESAISEQQPHVRIGPAYGISRDSVGAHARNHMGQSSNGHRPIPTELVERALALQAEAAKCAWSPRAIFLMRNLSDLLVELVQVLESGRASED
jgi:hypothetical protein